MRKRAALWAAAALLAGLGVGAAAVRYAAQWTPEQMEKRTKAAIALSLKVRRGLGEKYLPKTQELGPGWLLPWQLPPGMRKIASEDEYWSSQAGSFDRDDKAYLAAMTSAFLELSPAELDQFLEFWLDAARKGLTESDVPKGYTREQFALGSMILLLRWQFAPSLASRMEMIASYLADMQAMMAKKAETLFGTAAKSRPAEALNPDEALREILLRSVKGRTPAQLKSEISTWASAVKDMTALVFAQCDDWAALRAADVKALTKGHFRQITVALTVLDRDRMGGVVSDVNAEAAAKLQKSLNDRLASFRDFGYDVLMKKRAAELDKEMSEGRNPDRHRSLQEERARLPELLARLQKEMPKVDFEVYTRDFGDNCYVVNMKGDFKLPEMSFPASNLQACLRNGNAVVTIGLGGNFTSEQLKREMDLFLSEMDARTAFFRQ